MVKPAKTNRAAAPRLGRHQAVGLDAPLREFLAWVAFSPRTYAEAMEAWGSHCPRFTVWEDALAAGLIAVASPTGGRAAIDTARVCLTATGQAALDGG
jgi:hypothetical protein